MSQVSAAPGLSRRPYRSWLSAIVCLLAWFTDGTALLPSAVAIQGSVDRQHRVIVSVQEGRVAVVFHHSKGAQAPDHRHGALADVLTALAHDSKSSSRDHVIDFAKSPGATPGAPGLLPACTASVDLPPPVRSFSFACIRSTTLLI